MLPSSEAGPELGARNEDDNSESLTSGLHKVSLVGWGVLGHSGELRAEEDYVA